MSTLSLSNNVVAEETSLTQKIPTAPVPGRVLLAGTCAVVGVLGLLPSDLGLYTMWLQDPVKSIGMFVPFVSFLLILLAWRRIGYAAEGSWLGLVVLAATYGMVLLRQSMLLTLVVTPQYAIALPPLSVTALAYVSGVVLLFGGTRLYRAALFPILFILAVNPIPTAFRSLVDLPLQEASARVAREFAILLGAPLDHSGLTLVFAPRFGMFIAPGCDGIRGSITMAVIALVAGYLIHLRPRVHALAVAGALLLGYLFNFLRLMSLVVYYILGVKYPWIKGNGEMIDYYIGGTLFLLANFMFVSVLLRLKNSPTATRPQTTPLPTTQNGMRSMLPKALAFVAIAAICSAMYLRAATPAVHPIAAQDFHPTLPTQIGDFHLGRTWTERLPNGPIFYYWGEYTEGDGVTVALGVGPGMGAHDALICHTSHGERPAWQGAQQYASAAGLVSTNAALYVDPLSRMLEVQTICQRNGCGIFQSNRRYLALVTTKPSPHPLAGEDPNKPVPVLLQARTTNAALSQEASQRMLTEHVARLLQATQVNAIANAFRS